MTTGEHQPQPIVGVAGHRLLLRVVVLRAPLLDVRRDGCLIPGSGRLAPDTIDDAPVRNGHDPGAGVVGHTLYRPLGECGGERVLQRLFRPVERPARGGSIPRGSGPTPP